MKRNVKIGDRIQAPKGSGIGLVYAGVICEVTGVDDKGKDNSYIHFLVPYSDGFFEAFGTLNNCGHLGAGKNWIIKRKPKK